MKRELREVKQFQFDQIFCEWKAKPVILISQNSSLKFVVSLMINDFLF